jgi:hypothetical protein
LDIRNLLVGFLDVPKEVISGVPITRTDFEKYANIHGKKLYDLAANIAKAQVLYNLTPEKAQKIPVTCDEYDYPEIQVIQVKMKFQKFYRNQFNELMRPIFAAIPYPIVIIAVCNSYTIPVIRISMSNFHTGKREDWRNIQDAIFSTDWCYLNGNDRALNYLRQEMSRIYNSSADLRQIYVGWRNTIVNIPYNLFDFQLNKSERVFLVQELRKESRAMENRRLKWY